MDHGDLKTVGICVINTMGQMLLHQTASNARVQWDLLRTTYNPAQQTTLQAAHDYLQELNLTCTLHEVFTSQSHQHGGAFATTPIEHIIIAFTSTAATTIAPHMLDYTWSSIDTILKDIQEKPAMYTPGLKSIIEGIELYLKNYFKDQLSDTPVVSL